MSIRGKKGYLIGDSAVRPQQSEEPLETVFGYPLRDADAHGNECFLNLCFHAPPED
jgi:hypothetical protein